jgi:hypothetical protein
LDMRFNPVILLTRGEGWDLIDRFNPVIPLTRGEGRDLFVRFNPVILLTLPSSQKYD